MCALITLRSEEWVRIKFPLTELAPNRASGLLLPMCSFRVRGPLVDLDLTLGFSLSTAAGLGLLLARRLIRRT